MLADYGGAYAAGGNAFDESGGGCAIDSMADSCDKVQRLLDAGIAERCLDNDCGPQVVTVTTIDGDGRVINSSRVLRVQEQAGWNGSLDGTYDVLTPRPIGVTQGADFASTFLNAASQAGRSGIFELGDGAFQNASYTPQQTGSPVTHYPGFGKDDLKSLQKALTEAKKLIGKGDCQKALGAANINVADVIKRLNNLKPRPDTAASYMGYNMFSADKSTDPMVQQFLQTEAGKGAGAFIYGQNVMVRDKFLGAHGGARIGPDASRALALIHEAIHLTGRTDVSFGGSSKLNDLVIKSCFSGLSGHKDLSIVVP